MPQRATSLPGLSECLTGLSRAVLGRCCVAAERMAAVPAAVADRGAALDRMPAAVGMVVGRMAVAKGEVSRGSSPVARVR